MKSLIQISLPFWCACPAVEYCFGDFGEIKSKVNEMIENEIYLGEICGKYSEVLADENIKVSIVEDGDLQKLFSSRPDLLKKFSTFSFLNRLEEWKRDQEFIK